MAEKEMDSCSRINHHSAAPAWAGSVQVASQRAGLMGVWLDANPAPIKTEVYEHNQTLSMGQLLTPTSNMSIVHKQTSTGVLWVS